MDIFKEYATDSVAEVEGKDLILDKTSSLKIARTGNERYLAALRKKLAATQLDLSSNDPASEAAAETLFTEVIAETILVGWAGLTFKGKDLPYNTENAKMLLGVKDFRKRVTAFADSFEAFRVKADEAQGNA